MTKLESVAQICSGLKNGSILERDVQKFLHCGVKNVVTAVYPDWVKKHLTQELETFISTGIANPQLWSHDKQKAGNDITDNDIFSFLLPDQKTYQAKKNDMIHKCVSLADIQFYEKYPELVPTNWRGKVVPAWKSVVLGDDDLHYVPCLDCTVAKPYVRWYGLVTDCFGYESAGLSAS